MSYTVSPETPVFATADQANEFPIAGVDDQKDARQLAVASSDFEVIETPSAVQACDGKARCINERSDARRRKSVSSVVNRAT